MLLLIAASVILVFASRGGSGASRLAPRAFFRADVTVAINLAIRAHPILPPWFVWAMADKESTLDPRQTNTDTPARERSYGLFQINWNAHGDELSRRGISIGQLFDPMVNAVYWSELADGLWRAAISRGYRDDRVAYAVRLRFKGVLWERFTTIDPLALLRSIEQPPRFETIVAKWKRRFGA